VAEYDETARSGEHAEPSAAAAEAEEASPQEISYYLTSKIPYGQPDKVLCNNMYNLNNPEGVRVDSLCAYAEYTGADVRTLEPMGKGVETQLAGIVCETFAKGTIQVQELTKLIGAEAMMKCATHYLQTNSVPQRLIEGICAKVVAEARARAHLPFRYMGVEDNTALTGPFSRALVTIQEWYGKAWGDDELHNASRKTAEEEAGRAAEERARRAAEEKASPRATGKQEAAADDHDEVELVKTKRVQTVTPEPSPASDELGWLDELI